MNISELQLRFSKLDTPAISDAMDSLGLYGALQGIVTRVPGVVLAGPVFTVQYHNLDRDGSTFHNAGNYIDEVPNEHVILVDNQGRSDCTNWGGILTEMAQIKGIAGSVVYGAARDISEIRVMSYPLFSTAVNMVSGKNRVHVTALRQDVEVGDVTVKNGDWLMGDDNGVLVIPADRLSDVLFRAENVERTEKHIREAIRSGMPLVEARKRFRYDQPWLAEKSADASHSANKAKA
jgi:regulator of RNase E activity RraA